MGLSDIDGIFLGSDLVIQLDITLKPVDAAKHLMERLLDSLASSSVRAQIVKQMGDEMTGDQYQLYRESLRRAIKEAAGTAATMAELYLSGVTFIVGGGAGAAGEFILDVSDTFETFKKGHVKIGATQAALALIPFVPSSVVKSGKKIVLRVGGKVIGKFDAAAYETLKKALKYAELVNTNKWTGDKGWKHFFDESIPRRERERIRKIVKEHELIPNIPVRPGRWTRFADFSSVAMKIPGATEMSGKLVKLPRSKWKLRDHQQFAYLMETYFPELYKQGNKRAPDGFTWHHYEYDGGMLLVPSGIHRATSHDGGRSPGRWGYIGPNR